MSEEALMSSIRKLCIKNLLQAFDLSRICEGLIRIPFVPCDMHVWKHRTSEMIYSYDDGITLIEQITSAEVLCHLKRILEPFIRLGDVGIGATITFIKHKGVGAKNKNAPLEETYAVDVIIDMSELASFNEPFSFEEIRSVLNDM